MTTATVISLCVGVIGMAVGVLGFLRNRKQDDKGEGAQNGQILSDIGYIKSGIDDIKSEQRDQRNTNMEFVSRLTACEESGKQAHKRIDHLEQRIEERER